jgi:hypothetical protein
MRRRLLVVTVVLALIGAVAGLLRLTGSTAQGQTAVKTGPVSRTAWGDPDLQGIWTDPYQTPLQRPPQFANKESFTEEERAALDQQRAGILRRDQRVERGSERDVAGAYNAVFQSIRPTGKRTSLVVDPPDGRIPPVTAEGRARQARAPNRGGTENASWLDRGNQERCITYGVPWLVAGYNSYIQIFQTPSYVAILQEMIHDVRIVPLDGRPHVNGSVRLWNGDSRGRFEGDTLVVTTTNYSPKTRLQGSSENLKLVERFRRVAPDTLEYRLTFEDPTVWTTPWTMMIPLKRSVEKVYEYACHEGNHSLTGILAGARTLEKEGGSSPR